MENYHGKIVNLFEVLFKKLFVPEDNYFTGKVDTLKSDLNEKIPYQEYQNELNKVDETAQNASNSSTGISTSIDLNNYKFSDKLTINMKRFIDFMAIFPHLCYAITNVRKGGAVLYAGKQG